MSAGSDALVEAGRWLDAALAGAAIPKLLLVLGLGDGHLLDLLETRAPGTRVLAIEPDPGSTRAFHARRDWTGWLQSGRLVYVAGPDYAGADEAWRIFPTTSEPHTFLVHPTLEGHAGPDAVRAAQVLKKALFGARANASARQQFAPRYLTNTLRNAPAIAAGHDVRALTGVYRGVPAVIAAAGPSLDHVIDGLRDVTGRALLVAADTALRPLLTAGLAPQLAVGMDPSELNARHFYGLPACPDTWLVSESALDPSANRHFGNRTFWFRLANHDPWPWYRQLGLDVGMLEVWGSVVTAAFQVAVLAGCDPIVVVGADLSYTDGRPYCRGTTYEFEWARYAANGADLTELWRASTTMGATVRAVDLRGVEVTTTPSLLAFRDWLVAHAARSGRRVINATGAGMFFGEGIEQMLLAEAVPANRRVASPGTFARLARREVQSPDLVNRFREISGAIAAATPMPVAAQWAAFSGSGWDAAATVAALDEAVLVLQGGVAPDSGSETHAAATWILHQLPEAVTRWRAALLGLQLGPAVTEPRCEAHDDPSASLVDALDLLERIHDTMQREHDDLALPISGEDLGRVPLSGLFSWPASAVWDVQVFEAILGSVAPCVFPKPADSFFSDVVTLREATGRGEPATPGVDRPNATLACALLGLEWAMCAKTIGGTSPRDLARFLTWLRVFTTSLRVPGSDAAELGVATLILATEEAERSGTVELPICLDERALARAETGAIRHDRRGRGGSATPNVEMLASAGMLGRSASIAVWIGERGRAHGADRRGPNLRRVTPRVLTDEGVPMANIVYTTPRGVVCVAPFANGSFIVRENGAVEPAHSWPQPIFNELPFGPGGLVAWSSGTANWAQLERPYVMYRLGNDTEAIVEELPFRPNWGARWRDRLYWICFPSGLGSWAPGSAPAFDLPDLTLTAVDAHEADLVLSPCVRNVERVLQRRRATHVWHWRGDRPPEAESVGPLGAATSRSVGRGGWTAIAYPEADVVQLESADGRVMSMTCYYPFKVAWLERSLLVSTIRGELLLFDDLMGHDWCQMDGSAQVDEAARFSIAHET